MPDLIRPVRSDILGKPFEDGVIPLSALEGSVVDASELEAALSGVSTNLAVDVTADPFNAVGNGSADDTVAIQSAINSLTSGGVLYFPPGTYKTSAPLVITRSINVRGAGRMVSLIQGTTGDFDIFQVNALLTTGDGGGFYDLRIRHAVTPTAGAAIRLVTGGFWSVERCRITGYDGIAVVSAYGYEISGNYLVNCPRHAIHVRDVDAPDRGDSSIYGNTMDNGLGTGVAGLCYESGGGIKLFGNKILHHEYGVLLQPEEYTDTVAVTAAAGSQVVQLVNGTGLSTNGQLLVDSMTYTVQTFDRTAKTATLSTPLATEASAGEEVTLGITTSVFTITGNSMEGQEVNHIRAVRKGVVGRFSFVAITGNQFNGTAGGGTISDGIYLGAGVDDGLIVGNKFYARTTGGVACVHAGANADNWLIDSNNFAAAEYGVRIASTAVDIQVGQGNKYRAGIIYPLFQQGSSSGTTPPSRQYLRRTLGNYADTVTWKNAFRLDAPSFRACYFELFIEGTVHSGVSPIGRVIRGVLSRAGGTVATLTVLSDEQAVGLVDVDLSLTTTENGLVIRVKRNPADGGIGANITIALQAEGAERIGIL